ncbi:MULTISPECIES: twin-arginine translocase TatA/TatE family subunit [Deinococcus]|uniref:Sec-independent protein translocase protein TatA n=1 Tax=Deinococcus geothermalis (strain DSM 11300 / CIP 105573 / AG-3a) TaxID=319795 RepID=Q1IWX6_DEIGD|nr:MULTISPECIES: twin-arginine translocase TatA/TatE family subunit [Deinococcus]ABF46258.1 Sec-independent protein translocase component TatA/E family [Deinococcus geothermalis DSM 11300]TDE86265.1 twin-arginine translocase TatA/TatE family subunit [Deinococcus sp. S9]
MSLGPLEILLIIVVIALVFGARKLPELGRGMGQGIKEFKKEIREPAAPSVTDGESRPLDPHTTVSHPTVISEVTRTADGRVIETVTERDHRA